jgi:hypothetical protein
LSRISRGVLIVACLALLAFAAAPVGAKVTKSYCHPTGDYCLGVRKHAAEVRLEITTPSLTASYGLCARRRVNGTRECHHFRFKDGVGGLRQSSVDFQTRFGGPPSGSYCATWKYGGSKLHTICFAYKRKLSGPATTP